MSRPAYMDLGEHGEDVRIDAIGSVAMKHQKTVGFVTDDEPGKAERYISKLQKRFPGILILERGMGPVPNTVLIKVGPPTS